MKYKTFEELIADGWTIVESEFGTYYSYWKKDGKVLCEDDLIENWKMNDSHKKLTKRTHESVCKNQ